MNFQQSSTPYLLLLIGLLSSAIFSTFKYNKVIQEPLTYTINNQEIILMSDEETPKNTKPAQALVMATFSE